MKIYSIFSSINGECNCRGQGSWAVFIRTAGCSLGCSYCDTKYAQNAEDGNDMSPKFVVDVVENYRIPYVLITGGEPIEQGKELIYLVDRLKTKGIHVTVETNGTLVLPSRRLCEVDCYVVDYKMPSAGTEDLFQWSNVHRLTRRDWIKFVISDLEDYDIAKIKHREIHHRNGKPKFAFSPVLDKLSPNKLYSWMVDDNIWNAHLSLQLHKLVALPEPR